MIKEIVTTIFENDIVCRVCRECWECKIVQNEKQENQNHLQTLHNIIPVDCCIKWIIFSMLTNLTIRYSYRIVYNCDYHFFSIFARPFVFETIYNMRNITLYIDDMDFSSKRFRLRPSNNTNRCFSYLSLRPSHFFWKILFNFRTYIALSYLT